MRRQPASLPGSPEGTLAPQHRARAVEVAAVHALDSCQRKSREAAALVAQGEACGWVGRTAGVRKQERPRAAQEVGGHCRRLQARINMPSREAVAT